MVSRDRVSEGRSAQEHAATQVTKKVTGQGPHSLLSTLSLEVHWPPRTPSRQAQPSQSRGVRREPQGRSHHGRVPAESWVRVSQGETNSVRGILGAIRSRTTALTDMENGLHVLLKKSRLQKAHGRESSFQGKRHLRETSPENTVSWGAQGLVAPASQGKPAPLRLRVLGKLCACP